MLVLLGCDFERGRDHVIMLELGGEKELNGESLLLCLRSRENSALYFFSKKSVFEEGGI